MRARRRGLAVVDLLGAAMALAFVGSLVWGLGGAPGGRTLIVVTALTLAAALGWPAKRRLPNRPALAPLLLGDLTSAALLGSALTAMLLGHSYLIAPTMSLTPLLRLLAVLALASSLAWLWTATLWGAGPRRIRSLV